MKRVYKLTEQDIKTAVAFWIRACEQKDDVRPGHVMIRTNGKGPLSDRHSGEDPISVWIDVEIELPDFTKK